MGAGPKIATKKANNVIRPRGGGGGGGGTDRVNVHWEVCKGHEIRVSYLIYIKSGLV